MTIPLRLLLIEDSEDDGLLVIRALRKGPFEPSVTRVDTPAALEAALAEGRWDIAISDFSLPTFTGLNALKIIQATHPDLPVVICSGAIGEEKATELMRLGAKDYVMKDRLARLVPVIERELQEAEIRRERLREKHLREELEERLRQSQKMEAIGTLAGGIAHDFNNILAAVMGFAELSLETLPPDSQEHHYIQEILKAGNRAKDLVRHILAFSRKSGIQQGPVEIDLLLKEVVKFLRASLPSTIEIRQEFRTVGVRLMADPTQLYQVFMNLCTNAFHAMEEGGGVLTVTSEEVTLDEPTLRLAGGTGQPGPYLRVTVADTGVGIDPLVQPRIFDPFFTTKEMTRGTGLGLSVVHGIVLAHDGFVKVSSEMGMGSIFEVFLPLRREMVEAAPAPELKARTSAEGRGERIWIVDDEALVRQTASQMLSNLGYRVLVFGDSHEALARIREAPEALDLLLTDQTMPRLPGSELARAVIAIRPDLPIILCTGYSSLVDEARALEIGIRAFAMKPLLASELARLVRDTLDGGRAIPAP